MKSNPTYDRLRKNLKSKSEFLAGAIAIKRLPKKYGSRASNFQLTTYSRKRINRIAKSFYGKKEG